MAAKGRGVFDEAALAVPVFFAINLVERLRGKSDALLVIARSRR